MPSADKRARKKDNARAAREQREAAVKRKKRTRSAITVGVVGVIFIGVIVLLNAGGKSKKPAAVGATTTTKATTTTTAPTTTTSRVTTTTTAIKVVPDEKLDPGKTYTATISTNFGKIVLAMDTKNAPIAAAHFITLARNGVYNGSRWHRVIKGFVIQGGAPHGDPNVNYGKSVVGELPKGNYALGALAAAKTSTDPNGTFDAQFFIVTGAQGESLPDQYADFGIVKSGMDVVRKIEALKTDANQDPTTKATIDTITVTES